MTDYLYKIYFDRNTYLEVKVTIILQKEKDFEDFDCIPESIEDLQEHFDKEIKLRVNFYFKETGEKLECDSTDILALNKIYSFLEIEKQRNKNSTVSGIFKKKFYSIKISDLILKIVEKEEEQNNSCDDDLVHGALRLLGLVD